MGVTAPDYRQAFEMAPVGLVVSRHRTMVDCNEQVCAMFSTSRELMIGQSFQILYPSADEYERFGFFADKAQHLVMPGPFERRRFLALELRAGWLDGGAGMLVASGRRRVAAEQRKVA